MARFTGTDASEIFSSTDLSPTVITDPAGAVPGDEGDSYEPGDGDDTVGIYNSNTGAFFPRNSNSAGPADVVFVYGSGFRVPMVGESLVWNDAVKVTVLEATRRRIDRVRVERLQRESVEAV